MCGIEPGSAIGVDAALHLERGGIEFDDGETAEEFFLGVK